MADVSSPETLYRFIRGQIALHSPPEDRSGRSPLQSLSDQLGRSDLDSEQLQNYFTVAPRLVEDIPALSAADTTRLIKFILSIATSPPTLLSAAQRALARLGAEEPSKRADVLSLLLRLGRRPRPAEIEADTGVRNARPWLWFDLAYAAEPSIAIRAIADLARHNGFLEAMLSRLMRVWRGDEARFAELISAIRKELNQEQNEKLSSFLKAFALRSNGGQLDDQAFNRFVEQVTGGLPQFNRVETGEILAA